MGLATPVLIPYMNSRSNFVAAIHRVVKDYAIRVIIAANEDESCILAEESEALRKVGCSFLCPPLEKITAAANKYSAFRTAERMGVPVPRTILASSEGDLDQLDFKFPLVLKPASGSGGGARGVSYAFSRPQLRLLYLSLRKRYREVLVQEEIQGGPGSIHMVPMLYNAQGGLVAAFCSHGLKTVHSWGGYAIAGEPVENPRMIRLAEKLIDGFAPWAGPASVEFKVDARTGLPYLLEINTRINGYNYLACAAGMNFSELLVKLSLGETVQPVWAYSTDLTIVRAIETKTLPMQELEKQLVVPFEVK
jgi:predicted ATP-grasp superfamily ATP-dependent carboligase